MQFCYIIIFFFLSNNFVNSRPWNYFYLNSFTSWFYWKCLSQFSYKLYKIDGTWFSENFLFIIKCLNSSESFHFINLYLQRKKTKYWKRLCLVMLFTFKSQSKAEIKRPLNIICGFKFLTQRHHNTQQSLNPIIDFWVWARIIIILQ